MGNPAPKKGISYKGDGKWENYDALHSYRRKRDKKNKTQKASRKRNR